jgi:hypothetical protein
MLLASFLRLNGLETELTLGRMRLKIAALLFAVLLCASSASAVLNQTQQDALKVSSFT